MEGYVLTSDDIAQIRALLDEFSARFDSAEDPRFLRECSLLAHDLPRGLRAAALEFRLVEPPSGVLLVSGYPVDDERIGDTPGSWSARTTPSPTLPEELFLLLVGSLVGDSIGWSTQQNGYLVHDILPMRGYEHEQLGFGSEELLWWHTEDAFHPFRGDYLGMMCLRNPDGVATMVGTLGGSGLDPRCHPVLFEPRFTIKPDESHLPKNRAPQSAVEGGLESDYQRIEQQWEAPEKVAVLFGASDAPYLRLDPYFMDPLTDDPEAQHALDLLVKAIDGNLRDMVLQPGDICLIDNFRAVHGRKPFRAHFNGRDRWLKRINIVRDLRKSRERREESEARVLH